MKGRVFKSIVMGVVLALPLVWGRQAFAAGREYTGQITVASGGGWGSGSATTLGQGRLSTAALHSGEFSIPPNKKFIVWINCTTCAAAAGDSNGVFVETRAQGATDWPTAARSWTVLGATNTDADSTDFPKVFEFKPDMDSTQNTGFVAAGPGRSVIRGQSYGNVRVTIHGPQGDSLADGVGVWPIRIWVED